MKRLVNYVYWSTVDNFMNGSNLSVSNKLRVKFKNLLMTPGIAIIKWNSIYNYQGTKTVPQLPILKVGTRYRIIAHLSSVPAHTFLIRIIFRNIQGNKLQKVDFRSRKKEFVVPDGTVSYSIEIINNGCYQLNFDRLDICPAQLSENINDDMWIQPLINEEAEGPLNILLIADGKQSRESSVKINNYIKDCRILPINFCWQFRGDAVSELMDYIKQNHLKNFRIISYNSRLNGFAKVLRNKISDASILIVDDYYSESWVNNNISEPNMQVLANKIAGLL